MNLEDVIRRDTRALQPLASAVPEGTLYYVTDESVTERSNGTAWESYSDAGALSAHAPTHALAGTDPVDVTDLAGYPGGTTTFLRADATFASAGAGTHATTHSSAGSDPVTVTNLAGFPGGGTTFLRDDGTFAAPSVSAVRRQVTLVIDGGASVITTGVKGYISMPVTGTWKKWRLLSTVSGSIVIDVWKDTYANYPPLVADTITASAKPTLSSVIKNEDSALTGWTTSFTAGDVIGFNVDSVTTVTKVTLSLEFE